VADAEPLPGAGVPPAAGGVGVDDAGAVGVVARDGLVVVAARFVAGGLTRCPEVRAAAAPVAA
jgi:hypothetical protein